MRKKVDELVKSIISDQLCSYSDFGKELKEEVKSQINVSLREIDLTTYNKVIQSAIIGCVKKAVNEDTQNKIITSIDEIFGAAPSEITLNALCEKLLKRYWEDEFEIEKLDVSFEKKDFGGYSLKVSNPDSYDDELFNLYISD